MRSLVILPAVLILSSDRPAMLSPSAFAKASAFIDSTGRPLERALVAYHFAHGTREAVIAALVTFQNPDGGFASNLESDARWRGSSPMATMLALRLFNEVEVPASDPHARQAVHYLLGTFDDKVGYWHALPKGVNTAPHAPWWEVHDSTGRCDVESPVFPTAALAGYLRRYDHLLPPGFLDRITASSLRYLDAAPVQMREPDIQMLTELSRFLPSRVPKLDTVLAATVERDSSKWAAYTIQPLAFVPSPQSAFYAPLASAVGTNLTYMIAHQDSDGGWPITWSWEKDYPAAWAIAKREWRAQIALEDLERLAAFDRIAKR